MIRLLVLVSAALLVAPAGCASTQRARRAQLQQQLDALRYARPLDEVWSEARRLLAERDYPMTGEDAAATGQRELSLAERIFSPAKETHSSDDDKSLLQRLGIGAKERKGGARGRSLETSWRRTRDRFRLDGLEDESGCRVVFTHLVQDQTDRREEATRSLDLELELARRLDPEAAARIEAALEAPARSQG